MAHFLFVDESGQDQKESPCEVLAGVAIRDATLWPFIRAIHEAETKHFGVRYSASSRELKGKKLLKSKVFRHARQEFEFASLRERRELAKKILARGASAPPREYAALARAKLDFVKDLQALCARFKCAMLACIVPKRAPRPGDPDKLRKDYAYLFERFFYFLEDKGARGAGIIVFDELEKSRSHILTQQMDSYFIKTRKGRARSRLVIPEPFFVHSDLTTGIQVADLLAYTLAWGHYKAPGSSAPARTELGEFTERFLKLTYSTSRPAGRARRTVRGITTIPDLRGRQDRQ